MAIKWQNIKNPKLTGKAKNKEHFRKLNALAGGNLKILKKPKIVEEVLNEKPAEDQEKPN